MSCCDDKTPQGQQRTGLTSLVTGPRRWMLLGAVAVAGGLAMGWDQLVLLGIAPILIGLLPCLVMCGLGLCMMKCKDKTSQSTGQAKATTSQANMEAPPEASQEKGIAKHQEENHSLPAAQSTSKFQA